MGNVNVRCLEYLCLKALEADSKEDLACYSWAVQEIDRLTRYIAVLEKELADAAAVLQEVLLVGKLKHIGLLEVAAGVAELVKEMECDS